MLDRKPSAGNVIEFPSFRGAAPTRGTVTRVDDYICWFAPAGKREPRDWSCFIWRFEDGLNSEAEILSAGPDSQ